MFICVWSLISLSSAPPTPTDLSRTSLGRIFRLSQTVPLAADDDSPGRPYNLSPIRSSSSYSTTLSAPYKEAQEQKHQEAERTTGRAVQVTMITVRIFRALYMIMLAVSVC